MHHKPKLDQLIAPPRNAKPLAALSDWDAVLKSDENVWWQLPVPAAKNLRVLKAKDALYKRLPLTGVRLNKEYWNSYDTAAILGGLDSTSAHFFGQQTPRDKINFWPKLPGSGDWAQAPARAARFVPALQAVMLAERAMHNVPDCD